MTEQAWPTVPTGDPPVYPDGGVELNIGRHRTMFADRTGVVGYPASTDRSVYADGSGLQVKRRAGARWIQGIYGTDDAEKSLTVGTPDTSLWRIDRVVDRLTVDGVIKTFLKAGTAAATPSAPPLTQVAGGTWEESLATFRVAPNAVSVTSTDAAVVDERRFMPRAITPVSSASLRPANPMVGDEVDFPDGTRQRWNGSGWKNTSSTAIAGWLMSVTSGSFPWDVAAQFGSWSREGDTVTAKATASLNVNPPGTSAGGIVFSLPPVTPAGAFLGLATVTNAAGSVAAHGYVLLSGTAGMIYSFTGPVTVAPINGYTLTVDLRFPVA